MRRIRSSLPTCAAAPTPRRRRPFRGTAHSVATPGQPSHATRRAGLPIVGTADVCSFVQLVPHRAGSFTGRLADREVDVEGLAQETPSYAIRSPVTSKWLRRFGEV